LEEAVMDAGKKEIGERERQGERERERSQGQGLTGRYQYCPAILGDLII
jgi:hypothetical protein